MVGAFYTAQAAAEPAPPSDPSVVDGVVAVDRPVTSFVPKYQPELFVGGGYSGTFTSSARQWPSLVLSPLEGLLWRPGRFDVGAYSELRLGRPDEQLGRFEVGFGLEAMWRFVQTPLSDWAAVVRAAYLIDTSHPGTPLIRTGVGAQVSLVRSLALQLTYDQLVSPTESFSNGHELLHGLSVTIKVGLCPIAEFCHQLPDRPVAKLDRSASTCHQAALVCQAADHAPPGTRAALCDASVRALDTARHPASWTATSPESQALDPVGAFLNGIRKESTIALVASIEPSLSRLEAAHAASIRGLSEYAAKQRNLKDGQMLDESYSYLVTPVMVRDWLGCAANGAPIACATDAICERDTGSAP